MPEHSRSISLVDIGANLTHDSFDADRDAVIARAIAAGVDHFVITGSDLEVSRHALALARTDPTRLSATAGVHPHHASGWDATTATGVAEVLGDELVRAVGECGLDHFRNFSPPADQERAFRGQLELAVETSLPVFLHQRDAHDSFIAILDDHIDGISRAVAHCFTGDRRELDECLERGLYIGITGWICDERRGHHLMDLIRHIPLDRLMIETDAPYLLPRDLDPRPKSRRNEPMYLPHVLEAVARAADLPPAEIAAATARTSRSFFGLPG